MLRRQATGLKYWAEPVFCRIEPLLCPLSSGGLAEIVAASFAVTCRGSTRAVSVRSGNLAEVFHLRECAQLPQGAFLDLPDALPRHAEDFADFLQGCWRLSVESVAELEHASLAEAQAREGLSEHA